MARADVYIPFYERKWKKSTLITNKDGVKRDIVDELGERELRSSLATNSKRFSIRNR